MPSIMPISIDLHVNCPFYKKRNKKKSTFFFLVKFSHGNYGANSYVLAFLSQEVVYFFQMISVNEGRLLVGVK